MTYELDKKVHWLSQLQVSKKTSHVCYCGRGVEEIMRGNEIIQVIKTLQEIFVTKIVIF